MIIEKNKLEIYIFITFKKENVIILKWEKAHGKLIFIMTKDIKPNSLYYIGAIGPKNKKLKIRY